MFKQIQCLIVFIMVWFTACGPINHPPPSQSIESSLGLSDTIRLSKNHIFYVFVSSVSSLAVGENQYLMRFSHRDLRPSSSLAKVKVIYWMPDMLEMGKTEEMALLQPDGSYMAVISYVMPGRWEVVLKLEDGTLQDELVFNVQV